MLPSTAALLTDLTDLHHPDVCHVLQASTRHVTPTHEHPLPVRGHTQAVLVSWSCHAST